MPLSQWNHVAITWSRSSKRFNLFIDSIFKKSKVITLENVDLRNSGFNTFQVGNKNGKLLYKGWLSDIVILPHALAQAEIKSLKVSGDGWYKINTHQFKMFYEKKSWSDAKSHCTSIGGDLASFGSATEYQFVREVLLYPNFLMNRRLDEYT
ncbi:Ladderlectin [Exaiptasia diaphana]|nr:Ladderlectin [Exaiptasia diaphana]